MDGQHTIDAELVKVNVFTDKLQNLLLLSQCEQTIDIFEREHADLFDILSHCLIPNQRLEYGKQLQVIAAQQAVYLMRLKVEALQREIDAKLTEVEQAQEVKT